MSTPALRSPTGKTGTQLPKNIKVGQISNFDPMQQQIYQQYGQLAGPDSYYSRLARGDESMFQQVEAPAWRDFNTALGQLGSRFSMGGGAEGGRQGAIGSRRSSGFQNIGGSLASNFAQDLQANRLKLQQDAILGLRGISQELLQQRPYDQFLYEKDKEKGPSWWQKALGIGLPIAGAVAGSFIPGVGTAAGGAIGSAFGKAFM